jgi:hypothetical protein
LGLPKVVPKKVLQQFSGRLSFTVLVVVVAAATGAGKVPFGTAAAGATLFLSFSVYG